MHQHDEIMNRIDEEVKSNRIVLYMKGTKHFPQCGFSGQVVEVLRELGVDFLDRDILQDDTLRAAIKEYSNWPTLPQLYIDGKFIGGCDIVMEMFESGELSTLLENSTSST